MLKYDKKVEEGFMCEFEYKLLTIAHGSPNGKFPTHINDPLLYLWSSKKVNVVYCLDGSKILRCQLMFMREPCGIISNAHYNSVWHDMVEEILMEMLCNFSLVDVAVYDPSECSFSGIYVIPPMLIDGEEVMLDPIPFKVVQG